MPSNHLILCHPLLLPPSIFPSIRVFSNESALRIRWPKYWSFSFSISPSNEYSGLISFRIEWFDLLAVQGTLKSLLQHHSSKVSILSAQPSLWSSSHTHIVHVAGTKSFTMAAASDGKRACPTSASSPSLPFKPKYGFNFLFSNPKILPHKLLYFSYKQQSTSNPHQWPLMAPHHQLSTWLGKAES